MNKPIRFYVGSSLANKDNAQCLADILEAKGWKCTYRWFDLGKVTPDRWPEVAMDELVGVDTCEVFVLLLPGKFGAHTELGIALAKPDRPVYIFAPNPSYFEDGPVTGTYPSVFYFHDRCSRQVYRRLDEVVERLLNDHA